jgi:heme-degrading monooxygenase HmoA
MYARLITADVLPDQLDEFPVAFGDRILADITREPGFKGLYLLKDAPQNKVLALVLWETEADAQASSAGLMRERLPKMAGLLTGLPAAQTLEVVLRA